GGGRMRDTAAPGAWRGLSIGVAAALAMLAVRVYLSRFERLIDDHTVFSGVGYTEDHVTLAGLLIVSIALGAGAVIAAINAVARPRLRWLAASVAPAIVCYVGLIVLSSYMSGFIVKPNELVRERPYITHNIEMT